MLEIKAYGLDVPPITMRSPASHDIHHSEQKVMRKAISQLVVASLD